MLRILLLASVAACSTARSAPAPSASGNAVPMSCGSRGCFTSLECDQLSGCNHCFGGVCTAILPAEPVGIDAGVDATIK